MEEDVVEFELELPVKVIRSIKKRAQRQGLDYNSMVVQLLADGLNDTESQKHVMQDSVSDTNPSSGQSASLLPTEFVDMGRDNRRLLPSLFANRTRQTLVAIFPHHSFFVIDK